MHRSSLFAPKIVQGFVTLLCLAHVAQCTLSDASHIRHRISRSDEGPSQPTYSLPVAPESPRIYNVTTSSSSTSSEEDEVTPLIHSARPRDGSHSTLRHRYQQQNRLQASGHPLTTSISVGSARASGGLTRHSGNYNGDYLSTMLAIQSEVPSIRHPSPKYEWEQTKYSAKMMARVLKDTALDIPATIQVAQRDRQEELLHCFEALYNDDAISAACHSIAAGMMPTLRYLVGFFSTLNGCVIGLGEAVCAGSHILKIPYRMAQRRIASCQEAQRLRNDLLHSIATERYEQLRAAADRLRTNRSNSCWRLSPAEERALQRQHHLYDEAYELKRQHDRDLMNFSPMRNNRVHVRNLSDHFQGTSMIPGSS